MYILSAVHFQSNMADRCVLVYNGKIYNSGNKEDYTWMVFNAKSGYITKIGHVNPPLNDFIKESRFDLGGKRVLPGLHESHIHVGFYATFLQSLDLVGCDSIEELQTRLRRYSKDWPEKKWLVGIGWEHDKLGRYPTREDLDVVCDDRPVVLRRACHHIAVLNSKALEILGITKDTPDPDGGQLDRYPTDHLKSGHPNGITREANHLFVDHIHPTKDEMKCGIKIALQHCLQYGVTCVHTLESGPMQWSIYKELAEVDELSVRVVFVPYYSDRNGSSFPRAGEGKGRFLLCDRIKLFADGALGACTAALSLPYPDKDHKGLLLQPQDELNSLVADATSHGFRLEIHAIGDAAAESVLEALEASKVAPEKRPILVHCQILREDLIRRMKKQGVIASIQPQFVLTDARWIDGLLPQELLLYSYAWKTLLKSGIACCGGSDAPVESPQPLLGIYDAIFRPTECRGPDNKKIFRPEEQLSVTEAIDLYTKGGAFATLREHDLGQLLPGYQADFIVLNSEKDVCQHPQQFCVASVDQVWVAGQRKL